MRLTKLTVLTVILAAGLVAGFEFSAELDTRFGSDFTRSLTDDGGGDGDGLYFGELHFRPRLSEELGDWGRVHGSLEVDYAALDDELDVELGEAFVEVSFPWLERVAAGLHDLRWGAEGFYNHELWGLDAPGLIYDAEPLGLRLGHDYGALNYEVLLGLGETEESSDTLLAGLRLGYAADGFAVDLYALADSQPHDVRWLFFDQYVSRVPGVRVNIVPPAWVLRQSQFTDPLVTRHNPLQTLALGLTLSDYSVNPAYRLTVAYHAYDDLDEYASSGQETGGVHLLFYPEVRVTEDWFDGYVAAHVDYWSSHDADGLNVYTPYDSQDPIAGTLAYAIHVEPGVRLGDYWRVALAGGYIEPSTAGEDVTGTDGDDSLDASFYIGPRIEWFPVSEAGWLSLMLGADYRQWAVGLYDIEDSEVDESREITGWVRAEAQL